ncbi:MAG: DUF429 domain-containing protein [Candidatus Bathyarchaeia archaeon]
MINVESKCTIGIDLAALNKNSTGIALLEAQTVKTKVIHTDEEIMQYIISSNPTLIAIDAPLTLPNKEEGLFRKADKEMIKKGFRVLPPGLPIMKKLTLRAISLNKLIEKHGYKTIEVHPTSTRKALQMPLKDRHAIQEILKELGLKGELEARALSSHEIDAITAALTAALHLNQQTEQIGEENTYIIIPKKRHWRNLIV